MPRLQTILCGLAMASVVGAWTAAADTAGPSVVVLEDTSFNRRGSMPGTNYALVPNGSFIFTCREANARHERRLLASADDPDFLGTPLGNFRIIYAWDFGTGVPRSSLDGLSNEPVVNFFGPTTVKLTVFDARGNSTQHTFEVRTRKCVF